jgi:hypothetical protein
MALVIGHLRRPAIHLAYPSRVLALIVEIIKSNVNMMATLLYVENVSVPAWGIHANRKRQYLRRCQSGGLKRPHQAIADLRRWQEQQGGIRAVNQKHRVSLQKSK